MSHATLARASLALIGLSSGLTACKVKDPLYCDESTPCTDPALPFCDLNGEYAASEGIKRTCIPYPWDAGPDSDAGPACTPGEWTIDTVHSTGNVGNYSAVVVDSSGTVYLAYYDTARKLWLASGHLGDWTVLDPGEPGGFYVQMRVDQNDTIHLVHGAWPAGLRYLWRDATASEFSVEGASGDEAYDITFALDATGVPVACYTDATTTIRPKCIRRASPMWEVLAQPTAEQLLPVGLAIDSTNTLHLVMDTGTDGSAYVQGDGNDAWSDVEMAANARPHALVLDAAGHPHITYGQAGSDLRHATRVGPDSWPNDTVDSSAVVGSVLAIDSDGSFHAVYRDDTSASLKYAFRSSSDWQPETIDAETTMAQAGSVFVDHRGGVHVTYYDSSNRDLKYAYRCPPEH